MSLMTERIFSMLFLNGEFILLMDDKNYLSNGTKQ
jgi:hypothetical protein